MKRLQKFINRQVVLNPLKEGQWLASLGIEARYVPDVLEDFDEMEFGFGQSLGRRVIFTIVVEQEKLKRISLGYIPEDGDEDIMQAFSQQELAAVLDEKGNALEKFFEKITPA